MRKKTLTDELLESRKSPETLLERISELENKLEKCQELNDSYCEQIDRLKRELSNKEIEYTDLWDDALEMQSNIAELEVENDELKSRVAELEVTAVFKSLGEMGHIEQTNKLHARIAECESALISMVNQFFYSKAGENIFRHSFMSAEEEAAEYLVEHGIARWVGKNKSAICFDEVQE